MGNAGLVLNEDQDFEIYKEITSLYEKDYLPKIKDGSMTEKEAYRAIRDAHKKLIQNKNIVTVTSRNNPWERSESARLFHVGDVVKVSEFDIEREGVVLEMIGNDRVLVDFGDNFDEFDVDECSMICKAEEYELHDKVEVKDGGLSFLGNVQSINADGTYDVLMMGDDPDDIEKNVRPDKMRKVMTNRSVALGKLRKASLAVIASSKFWKELKVNEDSARIDEVKETDEEEQE